jgi:fumarylacetoacetase
MHDHRLQSQLPLVRIPKNSPFSLANIPFGIISTQSAPKAAAIAIGDHAL